MTGRLISRCKLPLGISIVSPVCHCVALCETVLYRGYSASPQATAGDGHQAPCVGNIPALHDVH